MSSSRRAIIAVCLDTNDKAGTLAALSAALYRLLVSPLANLPGPKLCALTRLPLMYREFAGTRRAWVHELHLQYGPVVRIAPDEVSFATYEAEKEIYSSGGSGYDKTSLYNLFKHFNTPNIFSTLERGPHAAVKKRFADRYNKTHITRAEVYSVLEEHVETFITKCTENLISGVDVYVLLHCFALDGVTGHMFYPNGLHSLTDPGDFAMMKELTYPTILKEQYFRHYFPTLARILANTLGIGALRTDGLTSTRYVLSTVDSAPAAPHTLLAKLRTYCTTTAAERAQAASECLDHLVAGLDTTGDALCLLMHYLSLPTPASSAIQARLHAELAAGAPADSSSARRTPAALDALPYLDAVVKEGLRVFCPVPMAFPRAVPAGGATVDGVHLPAGTIVGCQPYTLHRLDARVWPDPDAFVPERWLEPSEPSGGGEPEGARGRNRLFFAFGAGGRGCIGKNFALLEMKMLLAAVYGAYRTRVAPGFDASVELDDQIISSRPKDQTCMLVFEKATGGA
ncbi:cytochrome P450 [Trametes elegans]|nr:cytochrome P450 [Trametes elegans]